MAAVIAGETPQEAIDDFWRKKDKISSRSVQKGLSYAMEGYINNFVIEKSEQKLQREAGIYRSQCKCDEPHLVAITISDNKIEDQHCSCTAG